MKHKLNWELSEAFAKAFAKMIALAVLLLAVLIACAPPRNPERFNPPEPTIVPMEGTCKIVADIDFTFLLRRCDMNNGDVCYIAHVRDSMDCSFHDE